MANQPFDYTIINALERPTSSDLNQAQGQAHADVRLLARQLFQLPGSSIGLPGFIGDSFVVNPSSPNALTVRIRRGIGFQNGSAETNIGGVTGLTDEYDYKALTIQDRTISVPAVPAAPNHRIDLIQVRALTGSERLANTQSKDIYNPSLNSFNATSVYKTLTSDLTDVTMQTIAYTATGTDPLVYKTGQEVPFTDPPVYPTVDTGYLAVAYVYVTYTTTAITSSAITDARQLLYVPQTAGGMPPIGYADQVIVSNGTSWEAGDSYRSDYAELAGTFPVSSTSYTTVTGLQVTGLALRNGGARIRVQPRAGGLIAPLYANSQIYATNPTAIEQFVFIMMKIDGTTAGAVNNTLIFKHSLPANSSATIPYPTLEWDVVAGSYDISVIAKASDGTVNIDFTDLTLFVGQ